MDTLLASLDEPEKIRKIFQKHGMVGIQNVLSPTEIKNTILDIQEIIRKESNDPNFTFKDQNTWYAADRCTNSYGTIGKTTLFSQVLLSNRCHPNVQKAYSIVYNVPPSDLVCQHDRVGWMRPTMIEGGSKYKTPFQSPGLHLDIDPQGYFDPNYRKSVDNFLKGLKYSNKRDFISENNAKNITMGIQLQGVLNLLPNSQKDGGFHGVAGGHQKLQNWFEQKQAIEKDSFGQMEPNGKYIFDGNSKLDRKLCINAERLCCPAGTLIIFDATLPHGTRPNESSKHRMIQFMRYMPKAIIPKKNKKLRNDAIKKICKQVDFEPNSEQAQVLFV